MQQHEGLSDAIDPLPYFLAEKRGYDGCKCVEIDADCINHVAEKSYLSKCFDGESHSLDDLLLAEEC